MRRHPRPGRTSWCSVNRSPTTPAAPVQSSTVTLPATRPASLPAHDPADRRLHLDEPLPWAVQRVAAGQIDRITRDLTDPAVDRDEAVHTARKAMKRLRSLLRLVRDEVGNPAYRFENVVLRDTARRLAPARDGYVVLRTLDGLKATYGGVLRKKAFEHTRSYLQARHHEARRGVVENDQLITDVVVTLKTTRARYAAWEAADRRKRPTRLAARGVRDDYEAIAPGLRRVYGRGQRAMRQAYRDGTVESFHEWRKRAKYLRYQLEALEPVWPELLAAHAARLDELGELLGDDHDLAVLGEIIRDDDAATADQRERTVLLALIHRTRLELQYEARSLGKALYAEAPADFVARLGAYWDAARTA